MPKRRSDPRVVYAKVTVQVRDLVRVVGIVVPFAQWMVSVFVENSFYRAPGRKWAQETCVGCPQQRYAAGQPGNVEGRAHVGIVEGSCWYRARGARLNEFSPNTAPHVGQR